MMMELLNIFRELLLLTDGTLFIQHGTFRLKSRKFCIVFFIQWVSRIKLEYDRIRRTLAMKIIPK
jgi:hypothetical protein